MWKISENPELGKHGMESKAEGIKMEHYIFAFNAQFCLLSLETFRSGQLRTATIVQVIVYVEMKEKHKKRKTVF